MCNSQWRRGTPNLNVVLCPVCTERCTGNVLLDKLDLGSFFRDFTNVLGEYNGLTRSVIWEIISEELLPRSVM